MNRRQTWPLINATIDREFVRELKTELAPIIPFFAVNLSVKQSQTWSPINATFYREFVRDGKQTWPQSIPIFAVNSFVNQTTCFLNEGHFGIIVDTQMKAVSGSN